MLQGVTSVTVLTAALMRIGLGAEFYGKTVRLSDGDCDASVRMPGIGFSLSDLCIEKTPEDRRKYPSTRTSEATAFESDDLFGRATEGFCDDFGSQPSCQVISSLN